MYNVVIEIEAQYELQDAAIWYGQHSQNLGNKFLEVFMNIINYLEKHPHAFPKIGEDYYQAIMKKFPYVIVYKILAMTFELSLYFTRAQPRKKNEMNRNYLPLFIIVFVVFNLNVHAQAPDVPSPAAPQKEKIYLTNATIHVGNGKVLHNATIGFDNGKIVFLEENSNFKTDQAGKMIDCTGRDIYPGVIATNTVLGLDEVEAARATNDYAEAGMYNPDARAIISYNTDSRVTPTLRSNGVLYAQVAPQGYWVAGTSAVVQLDAWNWEDAAVKSEDGIFMGWPSMFNGLEANKEYDKQTTEIKDYFKDAKSYYEEGKHDKTNLRFESMRGLFDKSKNLYVSVYYVKEILQVISFAEQAGVNLVLVGAKDSYMIADVLAQKKIPVILSKCHDLPSYDDDDVQQPYKTPGILQKAGVLYCISIGGFWQNRNLMFEAGTATIYGISKEEALEAITSNAAKILRIDDSIGTLEKGKIASLIVSTGDLLDMKTSNIEYAFINGRQIDLNNKQKALYEKFSKKYGIN